MKRFIAILICAVLAFTAAIPCAAAKNDVIQLDTASTVQQALEKAGNTYPIVFVTGIGQTFSYYLDENSEKVMYLGGEEYHFSTMANLFLLDTEFTKIISNAFEEIGEGKMDSKEAARVIAQLKNNKILLDNFSTKEDAENFVLVIGQLTKTLLTGEYSVNYDNLCLLARNILKDNIIDENGKLPDYILSAVNNRPISEFDVMPDGTEASSFGKGRFYRDVPCRDILAEIGEDRVFCYNYAPFGNISAISDGLDKLINETILGENGYFPDAEKVVLVPMSMGAAMVSQYLYDCEQADKDPNVARVVSVVGCWNGSDIMADLIEKKYIENSKELFYTNWSVITGNDTTLGTVLDVAMHIFHHDNLSQLITDVLGAVCDEMILKTPSMLALIPSDRYETIRNTYLTRQGYENVLKELDEYHKVQTGLESRMKKLNEKYGIEFYFISGYGLNLGGGFEVYDTSRDNYSFFGFLNSANKVNSDEIIPIQSTAPGVSYVLPDEKFSDEYIEEAKQKGTDKYIDTFSNSVDLSTCYYPDHVWTFYQQVHQLDNNNTALKLAFNIAIGRIDSVNDCADTFPQFNDSRDLRNINSSVATLNALVTTYESNEEYASLVTAGREYLLQAQNIIDSTINHRVEEEAFAKEIDAFVTKFKKTVKGENPDESSEPSLFEQISEQTLKVFDEWLYSKLGHMGFSDVSFAAKVFNRFMKAIWKLIPVLNLV